MNFVRLVLGVLASPFRWLADLVAGRLFFRRLIAVYSMCAGGYIIWTVADRGFLLAVQMPGVSLVSAILVIFTAPLALYDRMRESAEAAEREIERARIEARILERSADGQ